MQHFDFILPVFRDGRAANAIRSIINTDPGHYCRLIVVDGEPEGSSLISSTLTPLLRDGDIYLYGPDSGIWDALNKGLEASKSEYVGWIGADDLIGEQFNPQSFTKLFEFGKHDCILASTVFFDRKRIIRGFSPTRIPYKFGGAIAHYSSFWRRSFIGTARFDTTLKYSGDLDFFYRLFLKKPKIFRFPVVTTFMEVGGLTTNGLYNRISQSVECFYVYHRYSNFIVSLFSGIVKPARKFVTRKDYIDIYHQEMLERIFLSPVDPESVKTVVRPSAISSFKLGL